MKRFVALNPHWKSQKPAKNQPGMTRQEREEFRSMWLKCESMKPGPILFGLTCWGFHQTKQSNVLE